MVGKAPDGPTSPTPPPHSGSLVRAGGTDIAPVNGLRLLVVSDGLVATNGRRRDRPAQRLGSPVEQPGGSRDAIPTTSVEIRGAVRQSSLSAVLEREELQVLERALSKLARVDSIFLKPLDLMILTTS